MWILFHSQGKSLCLLPGKEYVIGRKNVDLILEGDLSVSRKHAVLSVTRNTNLDVNTPPSTLKLVDEKSMHGTYIKINDEWHELTRNEERVLADTDTIRFGKQENEWRVMYIPLVVTMSNLDTAEKQQLRSRLKDIDGYLTTSWGANLTHLTMKSITLTIKAVCALASGKPIVTPEYWSQYLEMAANNKELPDCDKFIPPVVEPTINANRVSLAVNDERRSVFRGKHFVFASQIDLGHLGCMITSAGGTAAAFEDYIDSFDRLCLPDVILMSCSLIKLKSGPTQQVVQLVEPFNNAKRYLESRGLRVITDQEIGYAILYCSTEKYCNPQYTFANSSPSNASQVQSSRSSLDFSSQAVNRPTEEMESVPQSLQPFREPTNKQPVVQRSGNQQSIVHSDEATFGYSSTQASNESSRDIFASPIKVERASERETDEACDNRKRVRTPELGVEPEPKRPAHITNAPSRSVPIKLETEDLFSFTIDNRGHKRTRPRPVSDSEGEDDFTFSNEAKPKRDNPACLNESSRDLFASAPNSPMHVNYMQQQAVEACGSSTVREALGRMAVPTLFSPEQQAVQACASNAASRGRERKAVPALRSPDPPVVTPKRKKLLHDWDNDPPLKKSAPSIDTTAQTTSTVAKAPMSLRGFLNTTFLKTDEHEMDKLADSVTCIFLIETKDLVVREKTRLSSSLNETKNVSDSSSEKNFKRFQKVWSINHRILPSIIGGKDLHLRKPGADNHWDWDVPVDDTRDNEKSQKKKEKDEWDFPTPGKSINKSRKSKSNN